MSDEWMLTDAVSVVVLCRRRSESLTTVAHAKTETRRQHSRENSGWSVEEHPLYSAAYPTIYPPFLNPTLHCTA